MTVGVFLELTLALIGAFCASTGHLLLAELILVGFCLILLLRLPQYSPSEQLGTIAWMQVLIAALLQAHDFAFAAQITALMSLLLGLWRLNKRHAKGYQT